MDGEKDKVIDIAQRLRERKLESQLKEIVVRDESKWPVVKGYDIPPVILTSLKIINVPDAGSLFLSRDWIGTLVALGNQTTRWSAEFVLTSVMGYWHRVNCHHSYDGYDIVKVGSSITVLRDNVEVYRDNFATNNSTTMAYVYGFMDGWSKGELRGSIGSARKAIKECLDLADIRNDYISTLYINLMHLLSDKNIGHSNVMNYNQVTQFFKRSWVDIMVAYELDDHDGLKNYPAQLIAMVLTVMHWPSISHIFKAGSAIEDKQLYEYFHTLVSHTRGWTITSEQINKCTTVWFFKGVRESECVPYTDSLFGMRNWIANKVKEEMAAKLHHDEFIP